ncbi:MAG: molybdopterin cofactor-binding domain-containing protein [Hyphomicrobiales bacterium]
MTEHRFKGRREDQRLVTGKGRYTADHTVAGEARGHFLRADRAHAKIVRIGVAAARACKGVVGVLTGDDIVAAGLKSPVPLNFFKGVNGSSVRDPFRSALAHGRVRFVGEPVVLVVAETEEIAQDAAELIEIEYEDLPVVVDAGDALAKEAVLLHDSLPDNLAFEYEYGDRAAAERGFEGAAHVVRVEVNAQRIAGNPMEPKSCLARYDASDATFEIFMPTQGISDLKTALAQITGLDREKFNIRSMDVGGGFGVRNEIYPEFVAVMWAAKQFGRPVKWIGTRSETISGDHHGRAAALAGELALDAKGKFLALRVNWMVNLGAYCSGAGPLINTVAAPTSSAASLYAIPAVFGSHKLVFTNTTPTTAYRGAGRPNVAYLWERLVEEAARALGIDSIRLRRRNLLKKAQFPFKSPTGSTYDSGDPATLLDCALKEAGWDEFEARRRSAKKKGRLRGIGCALFLEPSGGAGKEEIRILVATDVLSEGLNLQDATRLFNYDIHWNSVRLMQRIVRVDRRLNPEVVEQIKNDHPTLAKDRGQVSFWNFLPPDELDDLLRLYGKVSHKTLIISKTLGIEGRKLLTPADEFEALKEFNADYEGEATLAEELHLDVAGGVEGKLFRFQR